MARDTTTETRSDRSSRRAGAPVRALVTGATGFIGSHLAVELARRGHDVSVLVRGNGAATAEERFSRILDWFETDGAIRKRLRVIAGELEKPRFGLAPDAWSRLLTGTDEIVNAAANTSFAEKHRAEIERANLEGLRNVLAFAEESSASTLHHVSTAYVAGNTSGVCLEELHEAQLSPTDDRSPRFLNPYEETKHQGEVLAASSCRKVGIRLAIYRPSIVCGNSETGKTFRFNALYHPVRALAYIRDLFLKDLSSGTGESARRMGISLAPPRRDEAGRDHARLVMPIRLMRGESRGLNIIPIDFCVNAFAALMEHDMEREDAEPRVYHLVNPLPVPLEALIRFVERYLDIGGLQVVGRDPGEPGGAPSPPQTALEKLFSRYIDVYQPYLEDRRLFSSTRAQAILEPLNVRCPPFTYERFRVCMDYAVKTGWGRTLGLG
ncbi:MAG TPA: SDR family oxidoreductase [Vicinamibacteria bacterium]